MENSSKKYWSLITHIDSVLDKLHKVLKLDCFKNDRSLDKLKVELRLVKTFHLCERKLESAEYSSSLEHSIHRSAQKLYTLLLRLDDGLLPSDLVEAASKFRQVLNSSKETIRGSYVRISDRLLESLSESRIRRNTRDFRPNRSSLGYRDSDFNLLDCLIKSTSPSRDEFMEFFHSLLENLVDILKWCEEACDSRLETLLEPLQEKLVFLYNFIRFVKMQGRDEYEFKKHCGVVAVSAASLGYLCWFYRDDHQVFDGMHIKISELIEKIKPVDPQVRVAYIRFLEFESFTLSTETDMIIVGNFLHSLLTNLWEVLQDCGTSFMVSLKHQIRILYGGLQFLRNIFLKHHERYNELHERSKDRIGVVVNDAGVVIFSLDHSQFKEASAKEIDVRLFHLLENIELIKAEVEEKYPITLRFNFPTTNELGFIDLLLENLKKLASCKVDPISFVKDRVEAIEHHRLFLLLGSYLKRNVDRYPKREVQNVQDKFVFFASFLENIMEKHNQHEHLQVQTMQEDLVFLRSFLENYLEQRNQYEEFHALWSHVIEVTYKAEFVIDSLIVGDISFYSLKLFHKVTKEINLLKTKTLEIDDKKYLIKAQKAAKSSMDVPSRGRISTINKDVVDLEDEKKVVIDQLEGGSEKLDIVSVVGMPGLGKTTLAQEVYRDPSITSQFEIRAWCCVSQVYCKKDWLLEILACIDQESEYSEMDEDDLANKLRQRLWKKKYLIVLDDVWKTEAWNALKLSFPNDNKGSRILLTSRNHEVIGKPHKLRRLTEKESWKLLKNKLGIREEGYPPKLIDLGNRIAKKCNGLPLSIVIIAGILRDRDQVGWEEIEKRLSNMVGGTEHCKSILELSYLQLPDHLKPCFLYFAAFREDQEIPIRRLMWLWIAEGFVQSNEPDSLEKIAEGYLMALINRSLVMVGQQRSIGGVKTSRIHDLLHVFCVEKAKDQNFLQSIQGYDDFLNFDEADKLRRLCIHSQPKQFMKSRLFCSCTRSILFFSRGPMRRTISNNLSFVFHLKLLRVLDLGQITIGLTFPSEIAILVQLRYLAVLGEMKDIPSSIANLSNLETFLVKINYSGSGKLFLPDSFWIMQKLRHLQARGALIDLSLAKEKLDSSLNLYNLYTFSTPELYLGESMEKIMRKFPNIRNLKCSLQESEESTIDSKKVVDMQFLSQLESLKLTLGNVAAHHLEIHLPPNLKMLTLEDFSWSIISSIGKLSNLEVLKLLRQADRIENWDMEEEEFPKLKFLKLECLNIVNWTDSGDHFPCLEILVLEYCKKLEKLPSCFAYSSTLELIEVHRCPDTVGSLVRDIEDKIGNVGNYNLKILISEEIEDSPSWSDSDSEA